MGFVPKQRTLKLIFQEPDLDGLEVTARSVSVGAFLDLADLSTVDVAALASRAPTKDEIAQARNLFQGFATVLDGWNIEQPEGVPTPATLEGLLTLEIALGLRIVYSWMDAIAGVAFPPREQPDTDFEASLPVEVLEP